MLPIFSLLEIKPRDRFGIRGYTSTFSVTDDGMFISYGKDFPSPALLSEIINHPDMIELIQDFKISEKEMCLSLGGSWVSKSKSGDIAKIWAEQPTYTASTGYTCGSKHCLARVQGALFPSVKNDECVQVI